MGVTVKQGAVFFFGFNILFLQPGVFDGHPDAIADQFQNIFLLDG